MSKNPAVSDEKVFPEESPIIHGTKKGWIIGIIGAIIGIVALSLYLSMSSPEPLAPGEQPSMGAKAGSQSFATNEQVRTAYNADIIDNPNFVDKDMLKMNDDHLAEVCIRPTVQEVAQKAPLTCKVA